MLARQLKTTVQQLNQSALIENPAPYGAGCFLLRGFLVVGPRRFRILPCARCRWFKVQKDYSCSASVPWRWCILSCSSRGGFKIQNSKLSGAKSRKAGFKRPLTCGSLFRPVAALPFQTSDRFALQIACTCSFKKSRFDSHSPTPGPALSLSEPKASGL
jgi:hypothetical protein